MKYKDETGKHTVEPNGTRFRYLLGVYTIDQNGKVQFNSFNDPSKTSKQNLEEAKRLFFNLPREQQVAAMNTILNHRLNEEL
jgi:hypothetical protein